MLEKQRVLLEQVRQESQGTRNGRKRLLEQCHVLDRELREHKLAFKRLLEPGPAPPAFSSGASSSTGPG
eukprot:11184679-Lingulodinium_polyedra.AAC.1